MTEENNILKNNSMPQNYIITKYSLMHTLAV